MNRKVPLVRGFDDYFMAPHSRHTEVRTEDIRKVKELTILAESEEAGVFLAIADEGRRIFVMGHPEYDRYTLDKEYKRDKEKGFPLSRRSTIIRTMTIRKSRTCSGARTAISFTATG